MGFFIRTIPEVEATGKLREFYEADIRQLGVASNTTRQLQPPA